MSRRDKISDFTRPVSRRRFFSRDGKSQKPIPRNTEDQLLTSKRNSRKDFDIKRAGLNKHPAVPKQDKSRVLQRKGLKKLPEFQPIKPKKRLNAKNLPAFGSMIALLIITPVLFYFAFRQNDGVVKGVKSFVKIGNDVPKYLIAGNVMDVPAKIEVVDNIDDGSEALDDNNKLGWYKESSKPGEPGAMIIAGFVSGNDNTGALKNITRMKKDDFIRLETGDGRIMLFQVATIEKARPETLEVDDLKKSVDPEKEGLTIITFTDRFSTNQDLTENRYVVRAVRTE